jgi:hypothetical protein
VAVQPLDEDLGEVFGAVAVEDEEAGRGRGHGDGSVNRLGNGAHFVTVRANMASCKLAVCH